MLFRHFGVQHGRMMLLEFAPVKRSQRRYFRRLLTWRRGLLLRTNVDHHFAATTLSVGSVDLVHVCAFLPSKKGQRGDHVVVVVVLGGGRDCH